MFKYVVLAIIQGFTEFLPISSSGHLVIFDSIFKPSSDTFFYIVVLHLGTMASLLVFFFKDIRKVLGDFSTLRKIMIVTFITGTIGFFGREFFESLFSDIKLVLFALFINGLIIIFANRKINTHKKDKPTDVDSLILGLTQGIGIIPGISRSGITISTLLIRGVKKEEAFKFSFLAAMPLIVLAFIMEFYHSSTNFLPEKGIYYLTGFFISFIVGYLSLFSLSLTIKRSRMDLFGYYCIFMSLLILFLR